MPEHRHDEIVAALAEAFAELTDTDHALRVAQQIHAGTVNLNNGITLCIPGSQVRRFPSAIDIERQAKPFARPLTRYQAEMPATKKLAEISTAASMCGQRQMNDGLKRTRIQSVGSNPPWTTLNPAIGPMIGPVFVPYTPQLRPIWKVMTAPATTPIAKPTAKMRRQNRNICS